MAYAKTFNPAPQIGKNRNLSISTAMLTRFTAYSGELGHTCKYENGKAACKEGACVLDSCDSGFSKSGQTCNALDFSSDLENCGKTGNKCSFKDGSGSVNLSLDILCQIAETPHASAEPALPESALTNPAHLATS